MAKPILDADVIDGIFTNKNYIRGQVDKSTAGWALYKDAVEVFPTDGTLGSSTLTWTRSTTLPLSDSASFLLTQPASNTKGEGVSYDFSIDRKDRYRIQRISFDYEVASGTFAYGSATITDPSDIRVFIFDVTNSALIEPQNTFLDGSGQFVSEFQTTNSQSYRLILHKATATATAFTFKADNFSVGPRELAHGSIVTDWNSYTATLNNFGTATQDLQYMRDGESLFIRGNVTIGASAPTGNIGFDLPTGLSINTVKVPSTFTRIGSVTYFDDSGSAFGTGFVVRSGTNSIQFRTSGAVWNATNPITFAVNDIISVEIEVPILGWASNVVSSSDSGTRPISFGAYRATSAQTATAGVQLETIFNVERFDSIDGYSISDGRFTAKESGYYSFKSIIQFQTGATPPGSVSVYMLKNGAGDRIGNFLNSVLVANQSYSAHCSGEFYLKAGDYVSVWVLAVTQNVSVLQTGSSNDVTSFYGHKIQSPQTVGMADRDACRYTSNASQSIPSGVVTIVNFEDKDYDDTGSVVVGAAWKWTAKRAGLAEVYAKVWFDSVNFNATSTIDIAIFKNGSIVSGVNFDLDATNAGSQKEPMISDKIKVVTGDTLDIRIFQNDGGNRAFGANSNYTTCSIELR